MPAARVEFALVAAAEVEAAKIWYAERNPRASMAFVDD
jgi:hypothetical protein